MLGSLRLYACVLACLPVSFGIGLLAQAPAGAHHEQSFPATREDVQELKRQIAALQSQITEVKELLTVQRAALPTGASRTAGLPEKVQQKITLPFVPEQSLGREDAPFVLVEFGDLQCPFCNDFAQHTFPTFKQEFVDPGKVRFLSVDFPLESHPKAGQLALASACAGEQKRYWEMREALMRAKGTSVTASIAEAALALKLENSAFNDCVSSANSAKLLRAHVEASKAAGVYSTPTFLLGRVVNGQVKGLSLVGDMPPETFKDEVEKAMRSINGVTNEQTKTVDR